MNSFLSLVSLIDATTRKHIDYGEMTHDSFQELNGIHPSNVKECTVVKYHDASFRIASVTETRLDHDICYDFCVVPV